MMAKTRQKVNGKRPFKKGMVQWENTDRNDTVKHVWTRHMIQMDLEPDAIKTQLCYMYGSFSTRMKYL